MVSHDCRQSARLATLRTTTTGSHPRKVPITRRSPHGSTSSAAALLARAEAHPLFAPGAPPAFECRLADENGWTQDHAARVVREDRRFLVLAQVAGAPVGPSDHVDRAWRLHLTRSADYERFCVAALGAVVPPSPLPERGGATLAATLARDRAAFGSEAPPPVWQAASSDADASARTSVVRLRGGLAWPPCLLAVVLALAVAAGLLAGGMNPWTFLPAPPGAALAELSAAAPFVLFLVAWGSTLRGGRRGARDTLDPYEAAWLRGGTRRMAAAATLEPARAALLAAAGLALAIAMSQFAHGAFPGPANGFFFLVALGDAALMAWIRLKITRVTPRGRSVLDKLNEWALGGSTFAPKLDAAGRARLPCTLALLGAPAMMHAPGFEGIERALDGEGVIDEDS